MEDILTDMIGKMADDINKKKEDALAMKIIELGLEFNFREHLESKPRFSKLLRIIKDHDEEYYYYDNGTHNGLFIVGFKMVSGMDFGEANPMKVTMHYDIIHKEPNSLKLIAD